jgi:hypothetical protein
MHKLMLGLRHRVSLAICMADYGRPAVLKFDLSIRNSWFSSDPEFPSLGSEV